MVLKSPHSLLWVATSIQQGLPSTMMYFLVPHLSGAVCSKTQHLRPASCLSSSPLRFVPALSEITLSNQVCEVHEAYLLTLWSLTFFLSPHCPFSYPEHANSFQPSSPTAGWEFHRQLLRRDCWVHRSHRTIASSQAGNGPWEKDLHEEKEDSGCSPSAQPPS